MHTFRKLLLLTCFVFAAIVGLRAQFLQVTGANTPPFTPENLISNIFLGDGVEVTSITYNGIPSAVGYFTGGAQSIGIERGIILTAGQAVTSDDVGSFFSSTDNASTAYDADLASQTTSGLNDVAVYTIKFIPTADTLRFRYCFGSEEYPEYACSPFNDVFGFFIQGPGYPTATNIAIVPGTGLPVTINNVHPANPIYNCGAFNGQFYNDNNGSNQQPSYDGYTDIFIAEAIVTPCQEYTIKLAIADVSDGIFDSGVFLEAKSFGTGSIRVDVVTPASDGAVAEGCSPGSLSFQLPTPATQDIAIDYNVWGTAGNGIDYQLIPPGLVIPAGSTELVIPIIAFEDNQSEVPEYIAVDVQRDPCTRDTVFIYIRDNGLVAPNLRPDTTLCIGAPPLELDGTLPIPLPDPPTFTNTTDYNVSPTNTAVVSTVNVFGVQPPVLGPGVIRSVCFNATHPWVDDLDVYLISPGGQFLELSTDNGANGDNYLNTCFTPVATTLISTPGPFAPASAAPFSADWMPEGPFSDLWDGTYPTNGNWQLQLIDDANGFTGTLRDWTITFEPSYKVDYQWTPITGLSCPSCAISNATPMQSTTYTVVATDSYGCQVQDSIDITIQDALTAPDVDCISSTVNSITFGWNDVGNSPGGYEVNVDGTGWVPASGGTTHTVTGLSVNATVTIEVRGINGALVCPANIGIATCYNCQSPVLNAATVATACSGSANGGATITTDNFNPPYTFDLGIQNNTTGNFTNLSSGSYTVTVTDVSGCTAQLNFTVDAPQPLLTLAVTDLQVSCFGAADGMVSAASSGGTGIPAFVWSAPGNPSGSNVSNLPAGTYTVTATDANGCTSTAVTTITQPDDLSVNLIKQDITCFGANNGIASATFSGGTGPYGFQWSNGQTTPDAFGLGPGSHSVTITDANGCGETSITVILEPPLLTAATAPAPVTCFGLSDGSATVTSQGGTSPHTYKWSNGVLTPTVTGLPAGVYSVTVTDNLGCTVLQNVVVTQPPVLTAVLNHTDVACNGGTDGTANALPAGGNGMYTYLWSNGNTGSQALNLPAGVATVTITDQLNCSIVQTTTITQPQVLASSATATNVSCFNSTNGTASLNVTGGTIPYSYLWNGGQTTQSISSQLPGNYTVTITDGHGCTSVAQAQITAPPQITASLSNTSVDCNGENSGALGLVANGGTGTLLFHWAGPNGFNASSANIGNLTAGTYTVTITDAAGCTLVETAAISEPPVLVLALPAVSDTICFGASDGTAMVTANGGQTPYSYVWTPGGQTTPGIGAQTGGNYSVLVTDANGCTKTAVTQVFQLEQVNVQLDVTDPDCHDGANGKGSIRTVFYGSVPANQSGFSYAWATTPVQSGAQAVNLAAGQNYTVTATDQNGCTGVQSLTMANPAPVLAGITGNQNTSCHNGYDGWASAGPVSGGVAPYSYYWVVNGGVKTDSLVTDLPAGFYRVTVTDAKGCFGTSSVTIGEPPALNTSFTTIAVKCFGGQDGSATVQTGGGTAPYQLNWNNGQSGNTIEDLPAGSYLLTVTDGNGCTRIDVVEISEPAAAVAATATAVPPSCFGGRDGSITIEGTGGTAPYHYALNGGPSNGSPVQISLKAGTYVPLLTDDNGCTVELPPVVIPEPAEITVDLGADITVVLGEGTQLNALVSNGTAPFSYTWDNASLGLLSCGDCPDPYIDSIWFAHTFKVEVVDLNGCEARDQVRVLVDKPRRIHVPTAFTPNGDLENDLLLVHGQTSAVVLDFRVYDRWGELLYQAGNFHPNDSVTGWDGNFRGKAMDPGVYVWVLEAKYLDGVTEIFKGNTTLIR